MCPPERKRRRGRHICSSKSNRESPFNATSTSDSKYTKLALLAPHFVAQLSITLLPEFTFQREAQPPPYDPALQFRKEQL
jgi:hypothetical protein